MKIYCDVLIQYKRFNELLMLSIKYNLFDNIEFTNNIKKCDLILLLVNSSKSLINLDSVKKNKSKNKKKNNNILDIIKSIEHDNVSRTDYFKYGKPVILIERLDSSVTWIRDFDKYPNIIGVIKNRIVRNYEINNYELFSGRYHAKLITDNLNKKDIIPVTNKKKNKIDIATKYFNKFNKLKKISKNDYNKFHALLWDFNSSPLSRKMKFYKNTMATEKTIDVFCVHTIKPGVIGRHREKAINIVNNMNITSFTKNCLENEYQKNFVKCKICVACWGFGEWTDMDGYAMYAKTILIKPNTDFVKMDPDLYNSKRYIPCKPDFSDLEEIINNILNNYDKYTEMLNDNRKFIMSLDKKVCAKNFWDKIRKVYSEYKKV